MCGENDLFLFSALTATLWSQRPLIQANAPWGAVEPPLGTTALDDQQTLLDLTNYEISAL